MSHGQWAKANRVARPCSRRGASQSFVAAVPDTVGALGAPAPDALGCGSRPCITTCLPQNATFPRLSLATSSSSPLSSSPTAKQSLSPSVAQASSSSIHSAFSYPISFRSFPPSAPQLPATTHSSIARPLLPSSSCGILPRASRPQPPPFRPITARQSFAPFPSPSNVRLPHNIHSPSSARRAQFPGPPF
jgi:hypothetical protein